MGVEFVEPSRFYEESEPTWHYVKPETGRPGPRAASAMMKKMTERASNLDISILLETWATKIRMDNEEITGVYAKNSKGDDILFECKAVVIATGGFASDHDWIKKVYRLHIW